MTSRPGFTRWFTRLGELSPNVRRCIPRGPVVSLMSLVTVEALERSI